MAVLFLNVAMIRAPRGGPGLWSGRRSCFTAASSPACAHAHSHGAPRGGGAGSWTQAWRLWAYSCPTPGLISPHSRQKRKVGCRLGDARRRCVSSATVTMHRRPGVFNAGNIGARNFLWITRDEEGPSMTPGPSVAYHRGATSRWRTLCATNILFIDLTTRRMLPPHF